MRSPQWWPASLLALGLVGGLAWRLLADPGSVLITKTAAVTTEQQSTHQYATILLFLGIGAILCAPWGFVPTFRRPADWRLVPAVGLVSALAGVMAAFVGLSLSASNIVIPKDAKPGDHIPALLTFDVWTAPLAWAVCGLLGVLVGAWMSAQRR